MDKECVPQREFVYETLVLIRAPTVRRKNLQLTVHGVNGRVGGSVRKHATQVSVANIVSVSTPSLNMAARIVKVLTRWKKGVTLKNV